MNRKISALTAAHASAGTCWDKKVLALLLSLVLCLSLLPTVVLAADDTTVAEVNNKAIHQPYRCD